MRKVIHAVNDGGIFFRGEVGQALEEYQKYSRTALPELTAWWRIKLL
jgi:hypothetical protein